MPPTHHASRLVQGAGLLAWLALVFAAAGLGAVGSSDASGFYAQLARPPWAPPAAVFGPVWSLLYGLMAVAAWLVWREQGAGSRRRALAVFLGQLAFNVLWSWLFFAWRQGALAFGDVLLLLALASATAAMFWRISRLAALLLLPYVGWVAFATALTWSIWQRNPGLL